MFSLISMKLCKKSLKGKIGNKFIKTGKLSMNYRNLDSYHYFSTTEFLPGFCSKLNLFPPPPGGGAFGQNIYPWYMMMTQYKEEILFWITSNCGVRQRMQNTQKNHQIVCRNRKITNNGRWVVNFQKPVNRQLPQWVLYKYLAMKDK